MTYKPSAREPGWQWELRHRVPNAGWPEGSVNVMTDLALAMKHNPKMKVMLMGGYFDLGTLYFGATYEMKHLPIPASLQSNISYKFFQTGHMVYVNEECAARTCTTRRRRSFTRTKRGSNGSPGFPQQTRTVVDGIYLRFAFMRVVKTSESRCNQRGFRGCGESRTGAHGFDNRSRTET